MLSKECVWMFKYISNGSQKRGIPEPGKQWPQLDWTQHHVSESTFIRRKGGETSVLFSAEGEKHRTEFVSTYIHSYLKSADLTNNKICFEVLRSETVQYNPQQVVLNPFAPFRDQKQFMPPHHFLSFFFYQSLIIIYKVTNKKGSKLNFSERKVSTIQPAQTSFYL